MKRRLVVERRRLDAQRDAAVYQADRDLEMEAQAEGADGLPLDLE